MVYVRNPKWFHGVGSQNNADVGCEKKNPFTALAKQNHVTNFGGLVLNRIEAEIQKPAQYTATCSLPRVPATKILHLLS